MKYNSREAKLAIIETKTLNGICIEGNNRKITQILSMREHLIAADEYIAELENKLTAILQVGRAYLDDRQGEIDKEIDGLHK